jgi:hypothetical protein
MIKFHFNIIIVTIPIVIAFASQASAQVTPPAIPSETSQPTAAAPNYFTLNLPAGVSLISAPLDTGPGLARDAFLGLPPKYPLFFGWNAAGQDWVSGDLVPAGIAGGYWVYLPSPTTLVVAGQPYSYFKALTKHVDPGWHLFGVPFQEGIGWKDFHLHASGNPIGLDTAVAMGWIDPRVITTRGSEVQYQTPGNPLLPGVAYWVHTSVPLELRAGRPAGVTPAAASQPPPSQSQVVRQQSSSSSEESTSTSVMGWLGAIAEFLADVAKGAVQIAEGNWPAAGFEFAAGTFGLVEYGLGTSTTPTDKLTQMDAKLDSLIVDVNAISGQLTTLNTDITGLTSYIEFSNALGINLQNAETWLKDYYLDQTQTAQSRNWARWYLAGCSPIVADNPNASPGCPSLGNSVTTANYNNFITNYAQHAGQTGTATDDFPLWWAYSVIGNNANGVTPYAVGGTKASDFVTQIHDGLTNNRGTAQNALVAYMQWVFARSGCTTDVSASGCDLFSQVYQPTEAFFLQAVGDQTQLAAAVAESDGVLAEKFPGSYGGSATTFMSGVNQKVNEEVEVFLEVAEEIALYRAADGTQDWNTFGSTDAGQLLARADFVAVQLGRQPDPTNPATANLTPPWPTSGVVGRIFYVNGEPALSGTRNVCTGLSQVSCASPVAQLSEIASPTLPSRVVQGDWPYLLWQTSSGIATGTPATQWTVQRLKPMSLPTGSYVVNSTSPDRLEANLVVATYDSNYDTVPAGTAGAISFGSLNGIEGSIGKYGLKLGGAPWTTAGGTTGDVSAQLSISYTDATDAPGGAYLNVTYPPIPGAPGSLSHGAASSPWAWSTSVNIQLGSSSLAAPFTSVHVHWPTTVNVNLNGGVLDTSTGICGSGCGRSEYYSYIKLDQQLLDKNGNAVGNASIENSQCNSSPFNACNITGAQSLDVGSVGLNVTTQYTFKVIFSSAEDPYDRCFCGNSTWRSAKAPSAAAWAIDAPTLTLTKQ